MSLIVTFSAVIKERFISTCRKCKRKFRKRRDERKEARECGPSAPPETLPLKRKRALTLPLPEGTGFVWRSVPPQETNYQLQSLFCSKLLPEIRRQIYQEVLAPGGRELHLANADRRLCSMRCTVDTERLPQTPGWRHECWGVPRQDGTYKSHLHNAPPDEKLLSLLCTCRLIYSEAIDILYTENTFNVRKSRTVVELPGTILPHRFHSIRSLHIDTVFDYPWPQTTLPFPYWPPDVPDTWPMAWKVIAKMRGLRNLRVSLSQYDIHGSEEDMDDESVLNILRPLQAVKVPTFVVEFFWPVRRSQVLRKLGKVSFTMVLNTSRR